MVLGEVIAGVAGGIRGLQELQPLLVQLIQGCLAAVNPIKQAKSHLGHACLLCIFLVFRYASAQRPPHAARYERYCYPHGCAVCGSSFEQAQKIPLRLEWW